MTTDPHSDSTEDDELHELLRSLEDFAPIADAADLKLSSEIFDRALREANHEFPIEVPCLWDDDYRLVERLGGGMSQVFLAEQINLGNSLVVIKVIRRLTQRQRELLEAESQTLGELSRKNLRSAVFPLMRREFEGASYFVMEYVRGSNLRQIIDDGESLEAQKLVACMADFTKAFSVIHDAGVIHGDVKPTNLMLDDSGSVRVIDFGLSSLWKETDHGFAGTRKYASPEQLAGNAIDSRTDVFSLGLVFKSLIDNAIFSDSIQKETLLSITDKMSAADPDSRFQSMADVKFALDSEIQASLSSGLNLLQVGLIASLPILLVGGWMLWATSGNSKAASGDESSLEKPAVISDFGLAEHESVKNWIKATGGTFEENTNGEIITVTLDRCEIVDSDLARLTPIETLEAIRLAHTNVTHECLRHLPDRVDHIYLDHTDIDDNVADELSRFRLRLLSLCYTKVTDRIGPMIGQMKSLEQLSIDYTDTTDSIADEIASLNRLGLLALGGTEFSDLGIIKIANANL